MTMRIAIGLALVIGAALWADQHYQDWAGLIWVSRKVLGWIEFLAFWNRL
jgi:hypothetical protein